MYEFRNLAEKAEVYLYGTIGEDFWGEGNSAKGFAEQLASVSPKPVDIHIDSGGGDVFEGFAMCSAIQRYEGETTAYIDGLAASAASYIAVVCDKVVMNDYAWLMIHSASTYGYGNAEYLAKLCDRLLAIDDTLVGIYESRTALTEEEIRDYMAAETWLGASDALEAGFCTEVIETEERMAACIDPATAKHYSNIPAAVSVSDEKAPSHPLPIISKKVLDQNKPVGYRVLDGKLYRKEFNHEL